MPTFPEQLSQAQVGYRFRARRDAESPVQDWIVARIIRPKKERVKVQGGRTIPVSSPGGVYAFPVESNGGLFTTTLVFFTEGGK